MYLDSTDSITRKSRLNHACEELYHHHRSRMIHYAHARGCDEHEALDLVQDVFLRLFRLNLLISLAARPREVQAGLLTRTLRWLILNRIRQRMSSKCGLGQKAESLDALLEDGMDIPCPGNPATEFDLAWAKAALNRSMNRLYSSVSPMIWESLESNLFDHKLSGKAATPALRVAMHRARLRLREIVTQEVGAGTDICAGKNLLLQAIKC